MATSWRSWRYPRIQLTWRRVLLRGRELAQGPHLSHEITIKGTTCNGLRTVRPCHGASWLARIMQELTFHVRTFLGLIVSFYSSRVIKTEGSYLAAAITAKIGQPPRWSQSNESRGVPAYSAPQWHEQLRWEWVQPAEHAGSDRQRRWGGQ